MRGRIFLASLRPYPPLSPGMVCRAPHKTAGGFIDTKQILMSVGCATGRRMENEECFFKSYAKRERERGRGRERQGER